MTTEQFQEKQSKMSNEELVEKVYKQISDLCKTGGKSFRMCIPPSVNDTDMLLCEMLQRFKALTGINETQTSHGE